jgi:hypothetical protein
VQNFEHHIHMKSRLSSSQSSTRVVIKIASAILACGSGIIGTKLARADNQPAGQASTQPSAPQAAIPAGTGTKAKHYAEHMQSILAEHQAKLDALTAKYKAAHAKNPSSTPVTASGISTTAATTEAQRKEHLKKLQAQHKAERKERLALDEQLRTTADKALKTDLNEQEEPVTDDSSQ